MNTKELQKHLKDIEKSIEPLREGVDTALSEHDAEAYRDMPLFMLPVIKAPLYEELHQLNADLREKQTALAEAYKNATANHKSANKALNNGMITLDLITSEGDIDLTMLEDISNIASENISGVKDLMRELEEIRTDLNATAWEIYFNNLSEENLLSDAESIASAFKIEKEDLGEEPPTENGIIIDGRKSLTMIADFETEHIEGHPRYLLPVAFNSLEEIQKKETLSPIITAYFKGYIKALKTSEHSLFRVESIVSRLLARLSDSKNILTVRPDTFYSDNTKLALQLHEASTENAVKMKIGEYKGEPVFIDVALSNEDGEPYSPDESDKELYDVCLTLWETFRNLGMIEGETVSAPLELIYQIYRKNFNARLDAKTAEDFKKRLLKFNTNISLNATAGSVLYPELGSWSGDRTGSIANIMIEGAKVNGVYVANTVHITALDKSPKYAFSKVTEQITATPMQMLTTKQKGKTNDDVLIERYLRERIETTKSQGYEILTSKVFEHAEIDLSQYKNPKDKRAKTIKKIKGIMNDFKDNEYLKSKGIKDWYFYKIGRDLYYKIVLVKVRK